MQNVHIVTDSFAHFTGGHNFLPVTIVPNKIAISGRTYREGVDLNAEDALRMLAHQPFAPVITPPSVNDYIEVYSRLIPVSSGIISIHASREMSTSWQNARAAAQQLLGHCPIMVIDSQTLSAGQAMLVRLAARSLEQHDSLDEVVRVVRGAVERLYSVFFVESMDYLMQNKIMESSHSILGTMLGIKPVLTIEHGRLQPMEKVRTRIQAIERLVEFAVEFAEIDDAVIVQHKPFLAEQTRMLQDRLAVEFPGRTFPYTLYGPSLAALIGVDATGLVVLEHELDRIEDDF
jgi:DegV family protein with EDD domain